MVVLYISMCDIGSSTKEQRPAAVQSLAPRQTRIEDGAAAVANFRCGPDGHLLRVG
jgi:hypothetical protein